MAKLSVLALSLLILGFISMVVIASEEAFVKPTPIDTWYDQPLPPQVRPGYYKFLGDCIHKTTKAYELKISKAIFRNRKLNDPLCCKKVMEADFLCNRALSFILALFDKFKLKLSRFIRIDNTENPS
ncbi:hypothetical protein Droror1_Dr00016590 [Drosera rotundifolia]